ncbi:MAG: hydantoinase/oxoprolinase family protein [Chloroflexi bacterium]|nr:hydantoinase/oxoprolinase family protein [Chloroflexota bacterium]
MVLALGIDTGGTYTDAILMEYGSSEILSSAKALTTPHNLAIGIHEAMTAVLGGREKEVSLVSVSTTLATNAIVEGNGAPVCAILIGYDQVFDTRRDLTDILSTPHYAMISGGHESNGEEHAPLDLAAAVSTIQHYAPQVAGFAISGYFATRNPQHELQVREIVTQQTGKPVSCGHELTTQLDAVRRAVTASLNASLIPLLTDLIASVQAQMTELGIDAPLMVVRGDGSLVSAEFASQRPVETVLSGPAASVVGAQHLGGAGNAVVVDMGGTTTDIALLQDGRPSLNKQGVQVGSWLTMVEAIDVYTTGLGGDSRVWLTPDGDLMVGPRRVIPLSLLGSRYPSIRDELSEQAAAARPGPQAGEFYTLQRPDWADQARLPEPVSELLNVLAEGPRSLVWANHLLVHPELYARHLERLEHTGVIGRAGLTPSDAAHVLGYYGDWDTASAELGAEVFSRRASTHTRALCEEIYHMTSRKIAAEVVAKTLEDDGLRADETAAPERELIARALGPKAGERLSCALTLNATVVGIGAPVATYFPTVGKLLHCPVRIPAHTEVANAIGAVVGSIVMTVHILIQPEQEEAGVRVHTPSEVRHFESLSEALAFGDDVGRKLAWSWAMQAGAEDIQVTAERHDHNAPVAEDWGDDLYISTDLVFTAIGRPHLAER